MNETAKPQRNIPGKKPMPGTPSPQKREEPSRPLRDDEDTLEEIDADEDE